MGCSDRHLFYINSSIAANPSTGEVEYRQMSVFNDSVGGLMSFLVAITEKSPSNVAKLLVLILTNCKIVIIVLIKRIVANSPPPPAQFLNSSHHRLGFAG